MLETVLQWQQVEVLQIEIPVGSYGQLPSGEAVACLTAAMNAKMCLQVEAASWQRTARCRNIERAHMRIQRPINLYRNKS